MKPPWTPLSESFGDRRPHSLGTVSEGELVTCFPVSLSHFGPRGQGVSPGCSAPSLALDILGVGAVPPHDFVTFLREQ